MALLLTPEQLRVALANLSMQDKEQLLKLLQAREALEAERPRDDRPPIWTLLPEFGAEAKAFDQYLRAAGVDPGTLPDGPVADRFWNNFRRAGPGWRRRRLIPSASGADRGRASAATARECPRMACVVSSGPGRSPRARLGGCVARSIRHAE